MAAAADALPARTDINPLMEEFCEGADRAVGAVVCFLIFMGVTHALIVAASLVIWAFEKFFEKEE